MKIPLQAILMAGEDMKKITMDGSKKITIRTEHRSYIPGPVLCGCHILNWACMREITNVRHTTFGEITKEECEADGCKDLNELWVLLYKYYGYIEYKDPMTVIYLK
jgi:hypothetical protein